MFDLIKQKSNYFKLYKNGIICKTVNNKFKNRVNSDIEEAKKSFFLEKFKLYGGNAKKRLAVNPPVFGKYYA